VSADESVGIKIVGKIVEPHILCYYISMKKYEVSPEIKKQVCDIAEKYGLALVMLFGSCAELRDRKESDVDIAYMVKKTSRSKATTRGKTAVAKLSFEDEIALAREFELLFKAPRADVVYLPDISPLFMYMILQDGVVLFEKESTLFPEMYTYAVKRFEDNKLLYQQRFEYLCNYYHVH